MSSSVMMNGTARQNGRPVSIGKVQDEILQLNLEMKNPKNDEKYAIYHGDKLIGVSSVSNSGSSLTDRVAGRGGTFWLHGKFGEFIR